jgi:hypothetical protein
LVELEELEGLVVVGLVIVGLVVVGLEDVVEQGVVVG